MYTRKLLAIVCLLGSLSGAFAQEGPRLGTEATAEQIAAWDVSVAADGTGLPAGSGNATQGATIYAVQCAACHGQEGSGKPNNQLVGGHGTLQGPAPVKTVGSFWPYAPTVFDYIRRAMPYPFTASLSDEEVYALTAYLLFLNGIIDEDDVMDAKTLPQVEMPNRQNFVISYP